ncbi:MAG: DUF6390 family protein [Candidatus Woesearchaeota archaeon]
MPDGLKFAARFSYITNYLDFCGPRKPNILYDFVTGKQHDKPKVEDHLSRFEVLLPYLKSISAKHSMDCFDYKVVEAYWLGNKLLDKFNSDDMFHIISALEKRGLVHSMADQLRHHLPAGMLPHHSFNVFYVGVGSVTHSVKATLQNMDKCRIACAMVREVKSKSLIVKYCPLRAVNKKITFGSLLKKKVIYDPAFLPSVQPNSLVALHWDFAVEILSEKQKENLEHYTSVVLDSLNQR